MHINVIPGKKLCTPCNEYKYPDDGYRLVIGRTVRFVCADCWYDKSTADLFLDNEIFTVWKYDGRRHV